MQEIYLSLVFEGFDMRVVYNQQRKDFTVTGDIISYAKETVYTAEAVHDNLIVAAGLVASSMRAISEELRRG